MSASLTRDGPVTLTSGVLPAKSCARSSPDKRKAQGGDRVVCDQAVYAASGACGQTAFVVEADAVPVLRRRSRWIRSPVENRARTLLNNLPPRAGSRYLSYPGTSVDSSRAFDRVGAGLPANLPSARRLRVQDPKSHCFHGFACKRAPTRCRRAPGKKPAAAHAFEKQGLTPKNFHTNH